MTSGKVWWFGASGLFVVAGLLVLSWPYTVSTFHLEAGGRALERALPNSDALNWWYVGPRAAQDPQVLQIAIVHLEQASRTSWAQRLLGRAYFSQGDLLRGVKALERFVEARPDHCLGHLELAAAYALMDQRLQEIEYVDLLADLPGASVSALDLEGPVLYQPEGWKSEYVYPTTFGLPPNYGDRPTLFVHAGSQVTYTVTLAEPSILRFGMGLDPRSLDWGGDGATFEVFVDGNRIFLEHLSIEQAHKGWQEREVDLRSYTGRPFRLALVTTPGPNGDITADWAGWGNPRLEAPEAAAYRSVVSGKPWVIELRKAGVTSSDFVAQGKNAQNSGQYREAEAWYKYAIRLTADRREGWYHLARLYQNLARSQTTEFEFEDAYGEYVEWNKGNWIADGGFEYQDILWPAYRASGESAAFELDSSVTARGKQSGLITGKTDDYHGGWWQALGLKEGMWYRFSCDLRIKSDHDLTVDMLYWESYTEGSPIGHHLGQSLSGDKEWAHFQTDFQAPSSDNGVVVLFPVRVSGKGQVWVDNVQLIELSGPWTQK